MNRAMDMHRAAAGGDVEFMLLLLERGTTPDAADKDGETPLHHASRAAHLEIVGLLLCKGADVNAKERSGNTPLHFAVMAGDPAIVAVLLEHGGDANAVRDDTNTPLLLAAGLLEGTDGRVAGATSISFGFLDDRQELTSRTVAPARCASTIVRLLVDHGGQVNTKGWRGFSPLHAAAMANNIAVLEHLIACGADTNARDGRGETPRGRAVERGCGDAARVLREQGAA